MLKNRYESAFPPSSNLSYISSSLPSTVSSNTPFFNQTFGDFKRNCYENNFIIIKYNNHIIYQPPDYQPRRAKLYLQGPEFAQGYSVFSTFPDESLVVGIEYG